MLTYPESVNIIEVGPRDGLQNEKRNLSVGDKIELINKLGETGIRHIEAGSFVSPKWVPQMSSSDLVLEGIDRKPSIVYSALTPNLKGYSRAHASNADTVAIFASASESFSQKNINCSIDESIERFKDVVAQAKIDKMPVRAYVSCILGCPYEGDISPKSVIQLSQKLLELGCYEVSLGDTIGVGTPLKTQVLLQELVAKLPKDRIALHFHDTYGQALANVLVGLQHGIRNYDSSVAGLGGCPYAKGASGNLASEDLVYMLKNMSIDTGVDLNKLVKVGNWISQKLTRSNQSKVGLALSA